MLFPQSPVFALEQYLESYLEDRLTDLGQLLDLLEFQHRRVSQWQLNLTQSEEPEFSEGLHMHHLGLDGNALMLEAIERLHRAVQDDDLDCVDEDADLLWEGHELVEESSKLCSGIEEAVEEDVFKCVSLELV